MQCWDSYCFSHNALSASCECGISKNERRNAGLGGVGGTGRNILCRKLAKKKIVRGAGEKKKSKNSNTKQAKISQTPHLRYSSKTTQNTPIINNPKLAKPRLCGIQAKQLKTLQK